MKVAILTPLQEELSLLIDGLEQLGLKKQELQLGHLKVFEFSELGLLVTLGGHGKTQFGIQAQYLLCHIPQIQLLVCAGAAGALSTALQIGDIVVATETVEHDYNLKFINRPLPCFAGDSQIIETLQKIPQADLDFLVHFGSIASGDEDIIEIERAQELAYLTDCIAVAWEGAGGARACKFNRKSYIELRCVTDTADHNAATDFEVNLTTALTLSALLATEILKRKNP